MSRNGKWWQKTYFLSSLICFQWFTGITFIYYFPRRFTTLPLVDFVLIRLLIEISLHIDFQIRTRKKSYKRLGQRFPMCAPLRNIPPSVDCLVMTGNAVERGPEKILIEKVWKHWLISLWKNVDYKNIDFQCIFRVPLSISENVSILRDHFLQFLTLCILIITSGKNVITLRAIFECSSKKR